tara:strand:- start:6541 stop:7305 length:765 start_codon:yes stop_codon:yes gene_type:complete
MAKRNIENIKRETIRRRDTDSVTHASIGLMDIDETIKYYFDNVLSLQVNDARKKLINVPVMYGTPERWNNVQKSNFYRDAKGKIQLPIIMYRRTGITKNRDLGTKVDVNNPLNYLVQNPYSKENKYTPFDVLRGVKPVKEYHQVVIPDFITATYECIVWTEFTTQMNRIIEALSYSEGSYWGDKDKFLVKAKIDEFGSSTEIVSGQDRAVKSEFTITIDGHIITNTMQKQLSNGGSKLFSPTTVTFNENDKLPE